MPWFKVPLEAYVEAGGWQQAQDAALALVAPACEPDGPLASAGPAVEVTPRQLAAWREMRAVLDQARADSAAGNMVSDPRWPGVRFAPGAAAALAALEFEAGLPE